MAYGLDILADPGLSWSAGDDVLFGGPYRDVLSRFATLESDGGRLRSNPISSARGLLHFLPSTWEGVLRNNPDLGFSPADIDDDKKQMAAGERLLGNEIVPALKRALGRDPQPAEMYAGWMLGAGGAQKLYGANPGAVAAELFDPRVARSNPSIFFWDKEQTRPRTVAEVAAEMERRYSGARPMKEPPQMAQQPEYDVDQGLANMDEMSRRVAMMRPQGLAALAPQQQPGGLSGLSPYLQLAAQLMPQRQGSGVWDAIGAAGAAMMQSQSPNFGAGLGAGLSAANQAMTQRQAMDRQDTLDRFKLGMQLAQFDQKDSGEYAMSDGVLYNKKTGQTQQVAGDKPLSDAGKLQSDLRAGRITPEQYEAAMAKIRGEGESPVMRAIREAGIDPASPDGQKLIKDYAARVGGGATVNIDNKAETAFSTEVAKADAKTWTDIQAGAAEAPRSNARLNRLSQLLDGIQTGKYQTSLMELQKGLRTVLGDNAPVIFGKAADVAQAEAAQALGNEIALALRNPAGGAGMPGAMSDADRMFLQSMVPGLETTPEGRKLMIETAKKLNGRNVEIARLAQEYRARNGGKFDGWAVFLADWAEKNPLFAGTTVPDVPPPAAGGPGGGAAKPGPRELPPSDADVRKQQRQQAPAQPPQSGGGIIPSPKRFDLGGPKPPPAGDIPKFTDPNDPGLARLPSGSVFYDGNGTLRVKP